MIAAIWAEIMTPSTFSGPLEKAYRRAVIGLAHAMLGAALVGALPGYGWPLGLALGAIYWWGKERGDLRRGGDLMDGIEDALMVSLGAWYGPWWWPAVMISCGAYLMAMGARK